MSDPSIGVAVIGAGMAGRAHAAGYRSAPTVYGQALPEIRFAAIADANPAFAADTARRFGYERDETGWRGCPPPTTSTWSAWSWPTRCTARSSRGCWPPASTCSARSRWPTVEDAEAMAAAAAAHPDRVTGIAFVFRRYPAIAAIRELLATELGRPRTSTATTGATTAATRRARWAGATRAARAPARWPTSAAT